MRALAKLVSVNNPDKVIFVGEALVGNEAVDQLSKFDRSLKDFSSASGGAGSGRGIDGMLVTKWDTVDDKVSLPVYCIPLFVHIAVPTLPYPVLVHGLASILVRCLRSLCD